MHLHRRVEQILRTLRPAFNYEPAYVWFVPLMWGALLANHSPAITSYLNAVGLPQQFYHQALHSDFRVLSFYNHVALTFSKSNQAQTCYLGIYVNR